MIDLRHGRRPARLRFAVGFDELARPQQAGIHGEGLDHHVGNRAHDFLLIGQLLHVLLRSRAGHQHRQLLGVGDEFAARRPGRLPVRRVDGPAITSSIVFLMAGSSASCPLMARFSNHPVMMRRLISLVPSKMRLTRESR